MRRSVMLAVALWLALPLAAHAADADSFTPAQRAQIVQILRDALRTDPSILREAVGALQQDDQLRDAADMKSRLATHQHELTATFGDPVAGNPSGDITLVEFYDPRCPYCRRMLPDIAAMLQKDPKLRLVYKDIPVLGPASTLETRAILAAQRQGAYEKMQQALMHNPAQPDTAMISETARGLGLDVPRLLADMNGPAVTGRIAANLGLARDLKAGGTPVGFVGDTVIPGAVTQAALEAAVAAARRHG